MRKIDRIAVGGTIASLIAFVISYLAVVLLAAFERKTFDKGSDSQF